MSLGRVTSSTSAVNILNRWKFIEKVWSCWPQKLSLTLAGQDLIFHVNPEELAIVVDHWKGEELEAGLVELRLDEYVV